jgi:hypothetical protein
MAVRRFQAALTPAVCNTIVCAEQLFTVGPGDLNLGATAIVSKPSINGAISPAQARVASATQIGITFCNPTAGNVTPTAGEVYQITVID